MISFVEKGDFNNTYIFLKKLYDNTAVLQVLKKYGEKGVEALKEATPVLTGRLASSWYYTIEEHQHGISLVWCNSDIEDGANVALLVQYGHGTKGGAYIEGKDFINPAIQPIIEEIANSLWKEVANL